MNQRLVILASAAFIIAFQFFSSSLVAASAVQKVIFTFGDLNERSGVLLVARDAGIFQKHGLDATVVNVRQAQVGMSACQT
jgi:ABC-type nitrate/sulfonate/bicarbonate transport system substrate-binding protein